MNQGRVNRVIKLITLLQTGKTFSADGLANLLKISRRTVFREIKNLRQIGIPCEFDSVKKSYSIGQDFFMAPQNLTKQEALSLMLLLKDAETHEIPFIGHAKNAILKVLSCLPENIRKACCFEAEKISAITTQQTRPPEFDTIFEQLHKATIKHNYVRLVHLVESNVNETISAFCPYQLISTDKGWYIIGRLDMRKKIISLKLSLISEVVILDKLYLEDEDFNLSEYLGCAWLIAPESRLYLVKLRFSKDIAPYIASKKWHSTQQLSDQKDGSLIAEYRVNGLGEIIWWIISFGDKVKVVAPKTLQEKVHKIASRIVNGSQMDRTVPISEMPFDKQKIRKDVKHT